MSTTHNCDFCGEEGYLGNDGIKTFVITCLGPGEGRDHHKGRREDVCPACAKLLHLSTEAE